MAKKLKKEKSKLLIILDVTRMHAHNLQQDDLHWWMNMKPNPLYSCDCAYVNINVGFIEINVEINITVQTYTQETKVTKSIRISPDLLSARLIKNTPPN